MKISGRWTTLFLATLALAAGACDLDGPFPSESSIVEIGRQGVGNGRFNFPREIIVTPNNDILVIDRTGRIQRLTPGGLCVAVWRVPDASNGTPTGAVLDRDGSLLVADTHYSRILRYAADGTTWTQFGAHGVEPGQMIYPTDVAVDGRGDIYVTNFGGRNRVMKFRDDGAFVAEWGSTGSEPGQFARPMALALLNDDELVVADSCNHRIQKFRTDGQLLDIWGGVGEKKGRLNYPYDVTLGPGGEVIVCEYGNNRLSVFDAQGRLLRVIGGPGNELGRFRGPWGAAVDRLGRLYVADTHNHRLQRYEAGAI